MRIATRRRQDRRTALAIATIASLAFATHARADVIYLSSGGIVKGTVVKETEKSITVKTPGGSISIISRNDIEHIERGESPLTIYQDRLKRLAPGDADGHYQLGMWLKNINEKALAQDEFQKTILLDPQHKAARAELGYTLSEGRWVLPHAEDAPSVDTVKVEEAKPEEIKLEPNGLSPELVAGLTALASKDETTRNKAFEGLDALAGQEATRLQAILLGPFSKTRERLAQALAKVSSGADAVAAKVPSAGTGDDALVQELKPHLATYLEKAVKPQVAAAVRQVDHMAFEDVRRTASLLRGYTPDIRSESERKRREKLVTTWEKVRHVAVETIFDLKIYPDENHGRIGQPIVDEKVDAVRAPWALLDQQLSRDATRWLGVAEADAKKMVLVLDDARARHALCAAWLESKGEKAPDLEDPAPIDEALARHRAGHVDTALALRPKLAAYEAQLLKRVRDQRVLDYNEGAHVTKPERGKAPTGEEREEVRITNNYRLMMGRDALEIDPRIVDSCRGHCQEMVKLGYFAHESPVAANKMPADRLKNAGYDGPCGENISLSFEAPAATHLAWYNSAPHHRNILGPDWFAMGTGKEAPYWTQEFGAAPGACKR